MKAQWSGLAVQVLERFDNGGEEYKVHTKGGEAMLRNFLVLRLRFIGRQIKDSNAVNSLWTKIGKSEVENLQQDIEIKSALIWVSEVSATVFLRSMPPPPSHPTTTTTLCDAWILSYG